MTIPGTVAPLGELPIWSPYAIAAGFLCGLVVGALIAACYALLVQRRSSRNQLARLIETPDPATKHRTDFTFTASAHP